MKWAVCGSSALCTISEESDSEQQEQVAKVKKIILSPSQAKLSKEFEVDYATSCTTLYNKLEQGQWACVVTFLESGYWPESFFADEMTPSEQARTWVTRHDAENPNTIRWSQLPLHLALVVGAPFGIVRLLIGLYPQSVYCKDDEAMLPLHLAMRYGSADRVVDLLIACYPSAINVEGKSNRTPLQCALRGENKIRGRILSMFVEGSKSKASKAAVTQCSLEVIRLKKELQKKELELVNVREKLRVLNDNIVNAQILLTEKIDKLKTSQNKIFEKTNKKIMMLDASKQLEMTLLQHQIERLLVEEREFEVVQQNANTEAALGSIRSKLSKLRVARATVENDHNREVDQLQLKLTIFIINSNKKIEALEKAKQLDEECFLEQIEQLKAEELELETDESFKTVEMKAMLSFLQDETDSVCPGVSKDMSSHSEAHPQIDETLKLIETRLIQTLNDKSTKKPISSSRSTMSVAGSAQAATDFDTSEPSSTKEKVSKKVDAGLGKSLLSMGTTASIKTCQDDPPAPLDEKHDPMLLARLFCMDDFSRPVVGPAHNAAAAAIDNVGATRGLDDDVETGACGMDTLQTYFSLCKSEVKPHDTSHDVSFPLDSSLHSDNSIIEKSSTADVQQAKLATERRQQEDVDCLKPGDLDPADAVTTSSDNGKPVLELVHLTSSLSGELQKAESAVLKSKASHQDAPSTSSVRSTAHDEECATIVNDTRKDDRHPTESIKEQESDSKGEQTKAELANASVSEVSLDGEIKVVNTKLGGQAASPPVPIMDDSNLANDTSAPDRHHSDLNYNAPSTNVSSTDHDEICGTIGSGTSKQDRHPAESTAEQESDSNAEQAKVEYTMASDSEVDPDGEVKEVDSKLVGQATSPSVTIMVDSNLANVESATDSTTKDTHHDDRNSIHSSTEQAFKSEDEQAKNVIPRQESIELQLSHVSSTPSPIDTSKMAADDEHKPEQTNNIMLVDESQQGDQIEQALNKRRIGFRKSHVAKDSTSTRPPLFNRAHGNVRSRIKAWNATTPSTVLPEGAQVSAANDRPTLPCVDSLETSVKQGKTEIKCSRKEVVEMKLDDKAPSVAVKDPGFNISVPQPDQNKNHGGEIVKQKKTSSFASMVERTKASLGHVSDSSSSHEDSIFFHVDEILSMISNAEISKARVESDLSDSDEPRAASPQADEDETRQDEPLETAATPPVVITFSGQRTQVGASPSVQDNDISAQCSRDEIEIQCSGAATSTEFDEHVVATEPSVDSTTTHQSDQSKRSWQKYVKKLFRKKKHKEQQQRTTRKRVTSPKNGMVE